MFEDLIEYTDIDEASEELFMLSGVTFKRDFGHWKRGQEIECVSFDLCKGEVDQMTHDGEVVVSCRFQLTALMS